MIFYLSQVLLAGGRGDDHVVGLRVLPGRVAPARDPGLRAVHDVTGPRRRRAPADCEAAGLTPGHRRVADRRPARPRSLTAVPGASRAYVGGVVAYATVGQARRARRARGDHRGARRGLGGLRPGDGRRGARRDRARRTPSARPGSPGRTPRRATRSGRCSSAVDGPGGTTVLAAPPRRRPRRGPASDVRRPRLGRAVRPARRSDLPEEETRRAGSVGPPISGSSSRTRSVAHGAVPPTAR